MSIVGTQMDNKSQNSCTLKIEADGRKFLPWEEEKGRF
jgi:hypothetical protein